MRNKFTKIVFSLLGLGLICSITPKTQYATLAESVTTNVYKGDVIKVEPRTLESSKGERQVVKGKIVTPSGLAYEGDSFSINEFGTYKVVYKAYFGFEEVKQTLTYTCQRRAVDFFDGGSSVDISYGQYRYNTQKTSHQGVILDMKAGSTVKFDTIVDVSRLTNETVLLDYIIDPENIGKNDFSNFTMRLSDAYDASKYVDIYFFDPGVNVCYNAGTHIRAGYENSFMGGADYTNGTYKLVTSTWGTPILSSFHAYPSQDPTHNAKIYFDYKNQTIYASPKFTDPYATGENKTVVNNFKNVSWYKSAVWGGFPSGKVKLSLTPGDFSSTSGRILIKQILGYDLSKTNYLEDKKAPVIDIDYENQDPTFLPKAVVNKPYKLFNATALDDFDKTTEIIKNVYYYNNGKYYDVSIVDNAFTPKKEGKYVIRYFASDVSGNESEIRLYIFTSNVGELKISLPYSSLSTEVFEETNLPTINELSSIGGTGVISYTRNLFDPNGNKVEIKNNSFVPNQIGTYKLKFEALDFVGNYGSFVIDITSNPLDKPKLVNEPILPPAFVNGYTYTLNKYDAFETTSSSIVDISNNVETYVDGVLVTSSFKANISNATLVGDKYYSTIEYKVTSSSNERVSIKKQIEVFDTDETKDKEKYFVGTLSSSTKYVTTTEGGEPNTSIAGVSILSTSDDGYSYFARELDSSYLNIGIALDEDASNYSKLYIKLTDTKDKDNTVTFKLNPNSNNPILNFPGYEADFAISKGMFNLRYVDSSKSVFDTSNKELSNISINDNGETFKGFKNGVYISFILERDGKVGDAGIIVTNLGNQPFTVSTGIKNGDKISPTIRFDDDIIADQHIGENFIYPHATAYDVLSEIKSLTGKVYYNNDDSIALVMDETMSNTFTITKYGTYDVEYIATDTKGKSITYYAHVTVKDTSTPEISITNDTISGKTFKLGDKIILPKYRVSDNLDDYILDMILICPNGERRCLLRDESGNITYFLNDDSRFNSSFVIDSESYRADMTGKFVLRLVAYDRSYNKVVKDLTYLVK